MANPYAGRPVITFALGRGKLAKALFQAQPLKDVTDALLALPKDISLKYQSKALKKAAKPGIEALRRNVAALGQVTGNLLASVTSVDRKYSNNRLRIPVGVVVVGFRRPTNAKSQKSATPAFAGGSVLKGPNRAYHSHLVEYGTKPRQPTGRTVRRKPRRVILGGRIRTLVEQVRKAPANARGILSSGFKEGAGADQRKGKRRSFKGRGQYPIDFIATGGVGPSPARRPLAKAFQSSKSQMQSVLDIEMRKALQKATREYQKQVGDFGGI
jgi:hypothetical protein